MAARTLPIVFFFAHFASVVRVSTALHREDCVFLTVSALWDPKEHDRPQTERALEMNWSMDPVCGNPDRVGLFRLNPHTFQDPDPNALVWAETDQNPEGFLTTNISFGRPYLPGVWDDPMPKNGDRAGGEGMEGDHCFGFYIAAYNGTDMLNMGCIKIRPTWMADHKAELSRMSLSRLVIPGTHNSACYHRGNKTQGRGAVSRYLLTQDDDVWTQLVHGIRYLDLRIGHYFNRNTTTLGDRFWVNHAIVRVTPLVPILRQIVRFVKSSPGEVVVVDFHRFPIGMDGNRNRHRQLITVLRKELGGLAIPPPAGHDRDYTLGDVWRHKKRLVVSYGERQEAADSKWLWPPISQMWGSQQSPAGLRDYVDEVMAKPRASSDAHALWAIMAELTPTPFDVLFDASGSLRQMADAVNRNVTTWIRDNWWRQANIVATDFFLGNNIIDVAVRANLKKAAMLDG